MDVEKVSKTVVEVSDRTVVEVSDDLHDYSDQLPVVLYVNGDYFTVGVIEHHRVAGETVVVINRGDRIVE